MILNWIQYWWNENAIKGTIALAGKIRIQTVDQEKLRNMTEVGNCTWGVYEKISLLLGGTEG